MTKMNQDIDDLEKKVEANRVWVRECFRGLGKEHADRLDTPSLSVKVIELALIEEVGLDNPRAHDIAFHLTDWMSDAAFLVAIHLFPERFSKEAVAKGVAILLAHAPNHLAAAAKLFGVPIRDIFEVGALEDDQDEIG